MTQIVTLLTGILVAAWIFAAVFFSAAQAVRQGGRLRYAHLIAALLTLATMGCLSNELWTLSQVTGAIGVPAGLAAFALENRWNRLLPLVHALFGGVAALGIPFGG